MSNDKRQCKWCGRYLTDMRADAKYCSPGCRSMACLNRQGKRNDKRKGGGVESKRVEKKESVKDKVCGKCGAELEEAKTEGWYNCPNPECTMVQYGPKKFKKD